MSDDLSHLRPEQFDIVHQGQTPLRYNRGGLIQRVAAVHPDLPPPPVKAHMGRESTVGETEYYAPQAKVVMGARGRLKQPKIVNNPSAAAPGTGAFVDFTNHGDSVFINYASTRPDVRNRGLASRLIQHVADTHPDHLLHFGKVMSPHIWKMKESLEAQGRKTVGHRDF